MITIRKANDRGHANHGWLDTFHTFSFAHYYDKNQMGFSSLRVLNDDKIAGGMGFDFHPHKNMEILTYIIDGEVLHKDNMGNEAVIKRFEIQKMSAGTGVLHSEYNHLKNSTTHLLQIWILPDRDGYGPSYEQKSFKDKMMQSNFILLASNDGEEDSIKIHQDIKIYVGISENSFDLNYEIKKDRKIYIHNINNSLSINDVILTNGDGAKIENLQTIKIHSLGPVEFLLFDIA